MPSFLKPTLHPAVFFVARAFVATGRKASSSNRFVRRGGGGAAGGDGEPVVEAADSRGVYQRSSSRRASVADLCVGCPSFGLPYRQ